MIKKLVKFDRYIFNASWIIGEKIIRLGVGFFATALVARHLGPERFGVLSYAMSFVAIFSALGHAGLSGLVVRELVVAKVDDERILGTAAFLKFLGILAGFVAVLGVGFFLRAGSEEFLVLVLVALSMLLKPFEVIEYWFESRVKAKYVALSYTAAMLIFSALRLALVFLGTGIIAFALAQLIHVVLGCLFLVLAYGRYAMGNVLRWKASWAYAKQLFREGWMVYLGAVFAVVYLKIDQVMLNWLVGPEAVGVYSVASTLSEVWYFVPAAVASTVFPRLIELKRASTENYQLRFQQLFDFLFLKALGTAVVITLCAQPVITIFFGSDFVGSASILKVHIWAAIFIFMRAAFSKWMIVENALMFSMITQGVGAISNVLLNIIFIPKYGALGAAVTTLVSYAGASYFSLSMSRKTRPVFYMMTLAIVSPIRYTWLYAKRARGIKCI